MRIIVDNGAYTLRNMGDVAMLQIVIRRAWTTHPGAEIQVLNSRPDLLQRYCPGTRPLSAAARNAAYPSAHSDPPDSNGWKEAWHRMRGKGENLKPRPDKFTEAFAKADMLLVAGGGFLNDLNHQAASAVLGMLEDGLAHGKRVALFSQGLGPLQDPDLLKRLSTICRGGAFIGVRERLSSPVLVQNAQALVDRWTVTGDDALEMTSSASIKAMPRNAIGFSIRQTAYSGIEPEHVERLRSGLGRLLTRTGAPVLALPISFNSFEDDPGAIEKITQRPVDRHRIDNPQALIATANRCRIVLAGTYHAAVFALGQGVPSLCFSASPYYRKKMKGLEAQFNQGCVVLDLGQSDVASEIAERGFELWNKAPSFSNLLRARSVEQVRIARAFCRDALTRPL